MGRRLRFGAVTVAFRLGAKELFSAFFSKLLVTPKLHPQSPIHIFPGGMS